MPAIVAQIADGENGGVMMNAFPQAIIQAHQRLAREGGDAGVSAGRTVANNGTEDLEMPEAAGVRAEDLPPLQAVGQHRLWQQLEGPPRPEAVEGAIAALQASDSGFSMAGASWTNNLSWVEGYANIFEPMQRLSADFHQLFDPLVAEDATVTQSHHYQQALLHLLLLETSCFRYWG